MPVVEIGPGEQSAGEQGRERAGSGRAAPDPGAAALRQRVERAQAGFLEDDFGQEIPQEEAALLDARRKHRAARRQPERGGQRRGQPVDRRTFLRRRRQIKAAQPALFAGGGGCVEAAEKRRFAGQSQIRRHAGEGGCRSAEELVLILQARHQSPLQLRGERGQLLFDGLGVDTRVEWEGRAPDLLAGGCRQAAKEGFEPFDQVGLGQHQVDGKADFEPVVQLRQPSADLAAMRLDGFLAFREHIDR